MPNVYIVCKTARFCRRAVGSQLLEPMARIVRTQEHIQIQRVKNEGNRRSFQGRDDKQIAVINYRIYLL